MRRSIEVELVDTEHCLMMNIESLHTFHAFLCREAQVGLAEQIEQKRRS